MPKFSMGRRRFTAAAVAAAATALIHPGQALGATESLVQTQAAAGSQEDLAQKAMAKLAAQSRAEVEMKVASILRKYGDKLSDEQKADIRRVMAEGQEGLEKMRAYVLENDDQPATVFHPNRQADHHGEGHHRAASRRAGHTTEGKR